MNEGTLSVLREHRRVRAARYRLPLHSWKTQALELGCLCLILAVTLGFVGCSFLAILALFLWFAYSTGTQNLARLEDFVELVPEPYATGGVVLLAVVCAAFALVPFIVPFVFLSGARHGPRAVRLRRRQSVRVGALLPQFAQEMSAALSGRYAVETDIDSLVRFLDTHRVGPIPQVALTQLGFGPDERWHVEGSLEDHPIALDVVVMPRELAGAVVERAPLATGPHLFVVIAGAFAHPPPGEWIATLGYGFFPTSGGLTLIRALRDELPSPRELMSIFRALGQSGPTAVPPTTPFLEPRDASGPLETAEAFLTAIRAGDYASALLLCEPEVWHRWCVMEPDPGVLAAFCLQRGFSPASWITEGEVYPAPGRVLPPLCSISFDVEVASRRTPFGVQLRRQGNDPWRISHMAVGKATGTDPSYATVGYWVDFE